MKHRTNLRAYVTRSRVGERNRPRSRHLEVGEPPGQHPPLVPGFERVEELRERQRHERERYAEEDGLGHVDSGSGRAGWNVAPREAVGDLGDGGLGDAEGSRDGTLGLAALEPQADHTDGGTVETLGIVLEAPGQILEPAVRPVAVDVRCLEPGEAGRPERAEYEIRQREPMRSWASWDEQTHRHEPVAAGVLGDLLAREERENAPMVRDDVRLEAGNRRPTLKGGR